jgi:Myosin head (motor domain)
MVYYSNGSFYYIVSSSHSLLLSRQTLRNDNSLRFRKFIHIFFDTNTGAITGASISNHMLEKMRICKHVDGERNYHIFYQLLSRVDDALLKGLGPACRTSTTSAIEIIPVGMNKTARI